MKNHILFIVENNSIPEDIRVYSEALTAKENGYDVSIISPIIKDDHKRKEYINGILVHRHPTPNLGSGKYSFIREYVNAAFWELLLSLIIYIKKPFKYIHAANPPDNILLITLIYKIFGVKQIFDIHDLTPELFLTKFDGRLKNIYKILLIFEKVSCRLANVIVTTNESYKKIVMKRHQIDPKKIFIVRNDPVRENSIKTLEEMKIESRKKIILYLGSINKQDGVELLIKSLHYLVNHLKERSFKCEIVGGGDYLEFTKKTAEKLNLMKYIDFKGFIYDREKVAQHLRIADICVEPAPDNQLNRHSTFIKIMEYMASAKPIVAFDLAETRISTNGAAILVENRDIIGFAKAIQTLIVSQDLRNELGQKGLNRIRKHLNWKKSASNLMKAYETLS